MEFFLHNKYSIIHFLQFATLDSEIHPPHKGCIWVHNSLFFK